MWGTRNINRISLEMHGVEMLFHKSIYRVGHSSEAKEGRLKSYSEAAWLYPKAKQISVMPAAGMSYIVSVQCLTRSLFRFAEDHDLLKANIAQSQRHEAKSQAIKLAESSFLRSSLWMWIQLLCQDLANNLAHYKQAFFVSAHLVRFNTCAFEA